MNEFDKYRLAITRRHFFSRSAASVGTAALGSLLARDGYAATSGTGGLPGLPHFAGKAKRVIYLF
ncbi:MAG: sulfatase, partial [Acidobacteria bacterium]|nr:sulfatase [Acidobacteriota bacterium]